MVKIGLEFKAELVNITNLRPDGDDFRWYIKLKCGNCGDVTKEFQYLTQTENVPLKGGRGHASMVIHCKFCSRENSIDILKDTIKPYNDEDSGKFKTIVVFECRGLEITEFSPRIGFAAEGTETHTPFPEVDLTEREWYDYDEKQKDEVSVTSVEFRFGKADSKKK